jgi:N-acetylmuramoyl-L-alanine amidase
MADSGLAERLTTADQGTSGRETSAPATPKRARRSVLAGPARVWRWTTRGLTALLVYGLVVLLTLPPLDTGVLYWPSFGDILARFGLDRAPPLPPQTWLAAAKPSDLLAVNGLEVAYWGKPDAPYGERVTRLARKPVAVVVHFTDETPAATLVAYGHRPDPARGGSAYGYHFYIDAAGRVLQGAPLGVRTNHIKRATASERSGVAPHLDGTNTIGISLIGACRSPRLSPITYRCSAETPTAAQIERGLAVIEALQQRFAMPCPAVYGHGELQTDRHGFEGTTLSLRARKRCASSEPKPTL